MATEGLPDDISGPDADTPVAKLNAAYETYEQDVKNADNAGEAMRLCLDAAERFAKIEAETGDESAERINSMARACLNQLADTKSGVDRKSVRRVWSDKRDELQREQQIEKGERVVFTDLIERTLRSVTKKVTTDRSSTEETEYVLKFEDTIGTELTLTQSILFDGRALWKAYTAAQDSEYPERVANEEVEWDNWIGSVLEDVGEDVEEEVGPRTAALRAIKNYVNNAASFGDRTDAVENGGVYVDDEPPGHSEVLVPREAVASITSTHEISDRALQSEISAREMTGPSTAGDKVSKSTTLNGDWQTFWCLDGDEFDVDEDAYSAEHVDSMDRIDDASGSDRTDSSVGSTNDDDSESVNDDSGNDGPMTAGSEPESDDGSTDEPGKIGSFVPDDGGEE